MNRYRLIDALDNKLKIALIHYAIAILVITLWLQGCSTLHDSIWYSKHSRQIECYGIASAIAVRYAGEGPTRICGGHVRGTPYRHAQAEVKINGKWEPMQIHSGFISSTSGGPVVYVNLVADVGRKDDYVKEFCVYIPRKYDEVDKLTDEKVVSYKTEL